MYALVSRVQVQPGKAEEGPALWRDRFLPALKQQQGFRGVIVLQDPQSNKGMAVALWDSAADADAGLNNRAVQEAFEAGRALLTGNPEMEGYTVLLTDWE